MLVMTSVIRVGQSKFVTVQIDEDSNERIMNCIQTLSELEVQPAVHEIFLTDTKAAFSRMLGAQEVYLLFCVVDERRANRRRQKRAAEKKEAETTKAVVVQVDDLLSFRQFSKKTADEAIDVRLLLSQV
jgi:coatomer subunit beta